MQHVPMGSPNPTMLSVAAEELSRYGLGKDSEGREAK